MKNAFIKFKRFMSEHDYIYLFLVIALILIYIAFKIYDMVMISKCLYYSSGFVDFDDNKKYFEIAAEELYEFYEEEKERDPNIKQLTFDPSGGNKWTLEYEYYDDTEKSKVEYIRPEAMAECYGKIRDSLLYPNGNSSFWWIKVYDGCVWFKSVDCPYILYSTSWFEPEHEFSDEEYYISREGLHWFSVWRKDSATRG